MKSEICAPRIFGRAIFAGLMLLGSTFAFAHNPDAETDPAAAAQWKAGAPQVQLEGQIEIVHQDYKDGHGKFVYTLKQSDGTRVPLQFVKHPPTHLLTGDHVKVSGQRSASGLVLYSGNNARTTGGGGTGGGTTSSSIPVPYTFGTQSVLVILVNFQDDAVQPYTAAAAQNAFFGTVNSFIQENSYQQTLLSGNVVGWYTIPDSVTTCNTSQIATDAQNAATAAGVTLSNYTRYIYIFPPNSSCGFAGASYVGGNPSQSWINGRLDTHVMSHELGHAFGLWHSHSLDCGTSATICSSGTIDEYGDLMDTMGTPQTASPHYNSIQKERLGWLNYGASPSIQTVTTSGTYTIYPYELAGPGPNALKILQSIDPTTAAKTWYYLESRQPIGFDDFIATASYANQNETTGVLFHLGTDGNASSGELLDMTPATPTSGFWYDMSLGVGQAYTDSSAGVTITPTAVDSTGATVQITMNGSTCTAANPTVSISPSQSPSVPSGTAVNFTATVTDNDSSGCSASTFNLAAALPSGWTGVWSAAGASLSPGKSGSATLTVTSPTGTADGSYNLGVSATNGAAASYSGSAAATYVISTPGAPSVSMWTDQSTYLPGQTVTVRVSLLSGASPDVGASVTVNVMSPSGKAATLSGTTGSNGVASLSYKLSRHAQAGTYQAQFSTTVTGASATVGASTSFTVQ